MLRGFTHKVLLVVLSPLLFMLTACRDTGPAEPGPAQMQDVTVFAASSLSEAFETLAEEYKEQGLNPTFNFAGSQQLAAQLSQGAEADVFVSADERSMQAAMDAGRVESGTQQVLTTNRLAVIVAPNADDDVQTLQDLAKPGVKLVLADPSVPIGNYTLQVLDKLSANADYGADFKEKVLANVVSRENSVRQVVAKVQLGEADAGVVYVTDAVGPGPTPAENTDKDLPTPTKVRTIQIPDEYNVVVRYYIAPIKDSPRPEEARRFMLYTLDDQGQRVLKLFGFEKPENK